MNTRETMRCPDEIAQSVLEILSFGIICARNSEGGTASIEADHLHNLPDLLKEYDPAKLRYYLDVEVPCYLDNIGGGHPRFEEQWKILRGFLDSSDDH